MYWRLWSRDRLPDLDAFLAGAGPTTPAALVAVLRVNQAERRRLGERVGAEAYLARYPEILEDPDSAVDLAYGEYLLREQFGEAPTAGEFLGRFPRLAGMLGPQIQLHLAIAAGLSGSCPPEPPAPSGTGVPAEIARLLDANDAAEETWRLSDPDSNVHPLPPLAIPGLEILGELGRGGMGVVYRARQLRLNRPCRPEDDPRRPVRPARRTCCGSWPRPRRSPGCRHPNIVQIYGIGDHDGRPYFELELVEGGSLADRLDGTPWPPAGAAELLSSGRRGRWPRPTGPGSSTATSSRPTSCSPRDGPPQDHRLRPGQVPSAATPA